MIAIKPESGATDTYSHRPIVPPSIESEASRRELVRRIVHSPTFGKSERLGALLTYVCDTALKGHEADINEQKIGEEVFGRSQDYDTAVDGIVRSQASRLRQRLDLYFQQEGSGEPIRIVIPRGGYVPVFEPNPSVASIPLVEKQIPNLPVPAAQSAELPAASRPLLPWGLSIVLGLALVALWTHNHWHKPAVVTTPPTHPFWSYIFTGHQPAMVVAPDSGLVLFHGMSGKNIDLKQYLEAGYRSELNGPPKTSPESSHKEWSLDVANRRYTSIVDVQAILSLKDRAQGLGSNVAVRYARDLRPNDFKTGTVILLGMSSANPWVELFENDMNFVLRDDYVKSSWVTNRNPQKGEPARWMSVRDDPERRVYGVVAFVPNLDHDGNALLIEGISMSGTEAAMDFLNDDTQLLPFLNRIRHPDGTLPHFELLLETHNMGASAVRSQIMAWRTRD